MKKLWSCLCFLVLAVLPISRGQNTTDLTYNGTDDENNPDIVTNSTTTLQPPGETRNSADDLMLSSSSQNSTTVNETYPLTTDSPTRGETANISETDPVSQTAAWTKNPETEGDVTTDTSTTATTSSSPVPDKIENKDGSSWGYVILVLIIVVIIILCVILYLLRRVSRTYSFDLQRPSPASHCHEPSGTFEQVYLDDLDPTASKDQVTNDDPSPPPAANGATLQSEEKDSSGENALQEQTDVNGLETLSIGINSPPADITSDPLMNTDIFFGGSGEEQQNENNNNPRETVCIDIHNTMEPSSGLLQ